MEDAIEGFDRHFEDGHGFDDGPLEPPFDFVEEAFFNVFVFQF